jgi:hypothetical protein
MSPQCHGSVIIDGYIDYCGHGVSFSVEEVELILYNNITVDIRQEAFGVPGHDWERVGRNLIRY